MKAITIHQPWATLIALGEKQFETRSWATKYRGELAIHAGKKVEKAVCQQEPFRSVLAKYGYTEENLPTGSIVARCQLKDCLKVSYGNSSVLALGGDTGNACIPIHGNEFHFGYFEPGRFAWEMNDIELLEKPIPVKGQQRIWNWKENE